MGKIQWTDLPRAIRQHLFDRLEERRITVEDLYKLKLWRESQPEVPDGDWYKDFGSFKICGEGKFPKTFLLRSQAAKGKSPLSSRRTASKSANNRLSDEDSRPERASRVEGSLPNRYTEKCKCN